MGMVMTLVIVVDEDDADDAMERRARRLAGAPGPRARRDPRRCPGQGQRSTPRSAPAPAGAARPRLIRLKGEVVKHPESVVLPLLLPDSPVALLVADRRSRGPRLRPARARWPSDGSPTRRRSRAARRRRCTGSARRTPAGNTDLAWTRITPWRALLAAALDQHPEKVTLGLRDGRADQPERRPARGVARATGCASTSSGTAPKGPGITEVVLRPRSPATSGSSRRRRQAGAVHPPPASRTGRWR